jgi:hypothetical protein
MTVLKNIVLAAAAAGALALLPESSAGNCPHHRLLPNGRRLTSRLELPVSRKAPMNTGGSAARSLSGVSARRPPRR